MITITTTITQNTDGNIDVHSEGSSGPDGATQREANVAEAINAAQQSARQGDWRVEVLHSHSSRKPMPSV